MYGDLIKSTWKRQSGLFDCLTTLFADKVFQVAHKNGEIQEINEMLLPPYVIICILLMSFTNDHHFEIPQLFPSRYHCSYYKIFIFLIFSLIFIKFQAYYTTIL